MVRSRRMVIESVTGCQKLPAVTQSGRVSAVVVVVAL